MKQKLLYSLLLVFTVTTILYPQATASKKEFQGKQETPVIKPPAYDSTQTLEEQYKPENRYQYIGLQLVLPPLINPEDGPILFSKAGYVFGKGSKNYTIVDILKGDAIEQLKEKKVANQCGYRYKDLNSPLWKELIIHVVFILKEKNGNSLNSAPLYWVVCESKQAPYSNSFFDSFIPAPYFEKQKQVYQNQPVIKLDDKSKWLCKEVILLKVKNTNGPDSVYNVFCSLVNQKGEQVQLRPPSDKLGRSFITEKEYVWLDHANKNQKDELLKSENDKREKIKSDCISKFGQGHGDLIAQHKIELGMTSDMCKAAWGAPWDVSKTTGSTGTKERWFYNWNYSLCFEKNILVKIEH